MVVVPEPDVSMFSGACCWRTAWTLSLALLVHMVVGETTVETEASGRGVTGRGGGGGTAPDCHKF